MDHLFYSLLGRVGGGMWVVAIGPVAAAPEVVVTTVARLRHAQVVEALVGAAVGQAKPAGQALVLALWGHLVPESSEQWVESRVVAGWALALALLLA